jgi:hypothetical protein
MEGGANVDASALTLISAAGAMTACETTCDSSIDAAAHAFGQQADGATLSGDLGSLFSVAYSAEQATGFAPAARAIASLSGSSANPPKGFGLTGDGIASLNGSSTDIATGLAAALQLVDQNGGANAMVVGQLTDQQVQGLTATQISTLTSTQVGQFSDHQISLLSADQLNALLFSQVGVLQSDRIAAIGATSFSGLASGILNSLSADQVALLTAGQLGSLSDAQIGALSPQQVNLLTTDQLRVLSSRQLALFNAYQINSITTDKLIGLTQQEIESFDPNQVQIARTGLRPQLVSIPGIPPWQPPQRPQPPTLPFPPPAHPPQQTIYTHGASLTKALAVLNGANLTVKLDAHWIEVAHTAIHTWLTLSSSAGTITLSWEPKDPSLIAAENGTTKLLAEMNADIDAQSCLVNAPTVDPPWTMGTKEFAQRLLYAFLAYDNSHAVTYRGTPVLLSDYNSNSGTTTLLLMAGMSREEIANMTVHLTDQMQGIGAYYISQVAPGWGRVVPLQEFDQPLTLIQKFASGQNLGAALLSTPYLRDMILQNPALERAFGGSVNSLQALSSLATALQDIKAGGVLNVVTGGLDLYLLAEKLLKPQIAGHSANDDLYFQNWIQDYGLQAIAALQGVVNGFEAGGVSGGAAAGQAADDFVVALDHLLSPSLSAGQLETAVIIGVVVGLATLIFGGNHDKPQDMPDKYDTIRYTQDVGELTGSAATAYSPAYDPSTDPVQVALGGLSELSYIQKWVEANQNSDNAEVRAEAAKLLPLYGTTGGGQLTFDHDIGDEAVVGGAESGTYLSIHNDAGQAVSEIQLLDAAIPVAVAPQGLSAPASDYGSLSWVPFVTADGTTGYWAPKGDGTYYYFGSDGQLYNDVYTGEVQNQDINANLVGNVASYDFAANDPNASLVPADSSGYGGVYYG